MRASTSSTSARSAMLGSATAMSGTRGSSGSSRAGGGAPSALPARQRPSATALVHDAKVRELTGEAPPAGIHAIDPRCSWPLLGPAVKLADRDLLALGQD